MSPAAEHTPRWLPRLHAGYRYAPQAHVQAAVTAAWLLMTELYAYIEDLQGAREVPDAAALVKVKIAELLVHVDCILGGMSVPDELHLLPLLMEFGLGDIAAIDGPSVSRLLGLHTPSDSAEVDRMMHVLTSLIQAFPAELVDALQPQNQGIVLRFLRSAHKACERVGCDVAFLAPLMRSL